MSKLEHGDAELLSLFLSRSNWERYVGYVKESALLPESWDLLKAIGDWFTSNPTENQVELGPFRTKFMLMRSAKCKPSKMAVYGHMIDSLDPSATVDTELLEYFIGLEYAQLIQSRAEEHISGSKGTDLHEDLRSLLEEYEKDLSLLGTSASIKSLEVSDDIEAIVNKVHRGKGGVEWRLEELNLAIGPLSPGDLVVVGARPNVGKTRFLVSELTHWMKQLPKDVTAIIFNNEEDGLAIKGAVLCATLNKDILDISKDTPKWSAEYDKQMGWGRIKIIDQAAMSTHFCEKLIRTHKPKVVVFNQLYKVNTGKRTGRETNDAERMRQVYQWAREIAKGHDCIVVSAHQADVSGEGQRILTQDKLYGTKTGVQGEVDLALMIGKDHDPANQNVRTINIARNKLPGGPRTKPHLRESHFEVGFDGARSRYISRLVPTT